MWFLLIQSAGGRGQEFHLQAFSSFENSPVIFTEQVGLAESAKGHREFIQTHAQVMNQATDSETELRVLGRI